jgi:hypothetical protein
MTSEWLMNMDTLWTSKVAFHQPWGRYLKSWKVLKDQPFSYTSLTQCLHWLHVVEVPQICKE